MIQAAALSFAILLLDKLKQNIKAWKVAFLDLNQLYE